MTSKRIKANGTDTLQLGNGQLSINQSTGTVTLGPGGFTGTHNINGRVEVGSTFFGTGKTLISSPSGGGISATGATALRFNRDSDANTVLQFYRAGTSTIDGELSSTGAWTLGPDSGSVEVKHDIQGYSTAGSNPAMILRQRSTADANPVAYVAVGSTSTGTANRFLIFTINGTATGSGQINANGAGACNFGSFSDIRLKENIQPLSGELDKILSLNPVSFTFKECGNSQTGFIAQEMEVIYPDAVNYLGPDTEEMKTITGWDKTSARIVKAIQELAAKLDAAEARIKQLEDR